MLKLIVIFKALAEVALFALIGQGILYVFAGRKRESNFFYGLLRILATPPAAATRLITFGLVPDRFLRPLAFVLVLILWAALILAKARAMRG
jgi:hypothetical protein